MIGKKKFAANAFDFEVEIFIIYLAFFTSSNQS